MPFRWQSFRDIDRQIRTILLGLVDATQAFLPRVRKGVTAKMNATYDVDVWDIIP